MTSEIARKWTAVFWKDLIEGPRTLQLQSCIQSAIDEATKEKDKKIERLNKMLRQPEPAEDVEALIEQCCEVFSFGEVHNLPDHATKSDISELIQSFLTAHDRAKDAEIRRLRAALTRMVSASTRFFEEQCVSDSELFNPNYISPLTQAKNALKGASDGRID